MADGILSPCNVARGSGMTCQNSPKRSPYWNSASGFDSDHITAVDMSFCTSLQNFIQHKKLTSCRFSRWRISAILNFSGPIMVFLQAHVRLPIGRQ